MFKINYYNGMLNFFVMSLPVNICFKFSEMASISFHLPTNFVDNLHFMVFILILCRYYRLSFIERMSRLFKITNIVVLLTKLNRSRVFIMFHFVYVCTFQNSNDTVVIHLYGFIPIKKCNY